MSDDRRTLREVGEWRPQSILRRFGPPPSDAHHLAHLLLALTIAHGPERVSELLRRLEAEGKRVLPRMTALADTDPMFVTAGEELDNHLKQIGQTRSRAANEAKGGVPFGMNEGDLHFIADLVRLVITALELSKRPTSAGIARTKMFLEKPPILIDAQAWVGKLTPFRGVVAAKLAQRNGRVVVIFPDDRLAYDPSAE